MPEQQSGGGPVDALGRPVREPGPDHRVTLEPVGARVRVWHGSRLLADTAGAGGVGDQDAVLLREDGYAPVAYVPAAAVVGGALRASTRVTYCPYKGEACYWSVVDGDGVLVPDAAWGYADPWPAVRGIAGLVAFDASLVTVEAAPPPS